jgi:hypothetical protein
VFYDDKYYWKHKTNNRSNSNQSSKNYATNRVTELSKHEDLIIFPPTRIVTVSDDSESELPQEEESDSELSDINSENVQHNEESEYHSQEDKIQKELRTKDKSPTSPNVPGAFDIPELRSDLGAAWDPPVGKRQQKPADKANMVLEAKLEEIASTQIDYACIVKNGPKSMQLALESTDSIYWRRAIETVIGTLEGHQT